MTADPRRVWLLLLACVFAWACGGPRSRLLAETEAEGEVAEALALIAELPDWSRTRTYVEDDWFTEDDVRAYVEAARAMRAMDPENVRAAYRIYVDWAAGQPFHGAHHLTNVLFVLDRVLFDLPVKVPWEERRYFADLGKEFSSLFRTPEYAALLSPVIVDDSGAIVRIRTALESRGPTGP